MKSLHDPLVASSDELDGRIIQQQSRENLSRSIDIWLRRTHAGGTGASLPNRPKPDSINDLAPSRTAA
ncbi:hypothetical protein [Sphingosinicella sp. BN140058]|uniref:hypothetical protein n=1 Tax=Sphingosinicella sp. BN140058 TaxID=1892855 RepID=UPI0010102C7F|nr:hypothetical protein [Sphingosinicella sp. BN140058]QAY75747.1 hypothetical protein ETR14_03790 [Sphingosinicella sp. BN140058]